MSTALDAVVSRILEDPDDDGLRLEAATLFDATDPPRAQHIRLGVEGRRGLERLDLLAGRHGVQRRAHRRGHRTSPRERVVNSITAVILHS